MTFGDDDYSVFDRLWTAIGDKFAFLVPLRIIRRPETLTILDYRPTFTMLLTFGGLVVLAVSFIFLFFGIDTAIVSGLWTIAIPAAVCLIFLFRGTIREAYYFNNMTDSYVFVRQFVYRKD